MREDQRGEDQHVPHEQKTQPASLHAPVQRPQKDEDQGETQRVAELPGQSAEDVRSVDGVALHQKEGRSECGRHQRERFGQPEQAAEDVAGYRKEKHSQDSDQLESQSIWQQYIERGNEQEREREVEREHGHPRIPSLRPSGDPEVGQELFYHLLRGIVVCSGVPAGGSGYTEEQIRTIEVQQCSKDDAEDRNGGKMVGPTSFRSHFFFSFHSSMRRRIKPSIVRGMRLSMLEREARRSSTLTGTDCTRIPALRARITSSVSKRSSFMTVSGTNLSTTSLRKTLIPWVSSILGSKRMRSMRVKVWLISFRSWERRSSEEACSLLPTTMPASASSGSA